MHLRTENQRLPFTRAHEDDHTACAHQRRHRHKRLAGPRKLPRGAATFQQKARTFAEEHVNVNVRLARRRRTSLGRPGRMTVPRTRTRKGLAFLSAYLMTLSPSYHSYIMLSNSSLELLLNLLKLLNSSLKLRN
jgi:hypothetical protein|eukprot:COSAG06_NODE_5145_length_3682_cov_3.651130_4_plen_134_part_00